jgi:hypothetical protein
MSFYLWRNRFATLLNYPTVGYAPALVNFAGALGAACVPSSATGCLIDSVLANNDNLAVERADILARARWLVV